MKKGTKTTIGIVALLTATAVIPFACTSSSSNIKYETAEVKRGNIAKTITATGTVKPITQVEVGTQVSGIIDKLYADYNSVVAKGDVLAEMDRTNLIAELNSMTASLNSTQVEYDYQTKNYERYRGLHDKGLVSDTDFESAEYKYLTAKQSLERQKSEIAKSRRNLEYATITSPIDGVVLSREVDEGQTVASGFNTPTLFTIAADLTKMRVIANVDEADIGQIANGQKVTFTVDAFPDDVFEGSITQVRLQPTTTSSVVTYQVVVDAPNPDLKLKPGLTANITVYTLERENVLNIAMRSLRYQPDPLPANYEAPTDKYTKTLWLQSAEGITPVNVTVGENDGIYAEISGDIKEGDVAITGIATTRTVETTQSAFSAMRPDEGEAPRPAGPMGAPAQ